MKLKPTSFLPFRRKSRSVARSDPGSLSSGSSASSSSTDLKETPKSVLPGQAREWLDLEPQLDDAAEVFRLLDRDGDGKISKQELDLVFRRLGVGSPTEEELGLILEEADRDGDGYISLEEFGELSLRLGPAGGSELREAFDYYDADGDGKISAEELFEVFSCIGEEGCTLEDCRRMIVNVDSDGDGFVCFQDFARMMKPQR